MAIHARIAQNAPTEAPADYAMHWIDKVARRAWISAGKSTIDDWIEVKVPDWADITGDVEDNTSLINKINQIIASNLIEGDNISIDKVTNYPFITISASLGSVVLADGTYGDIVVQNSGTEFIVNTGAIDEGKLADGAVTTNKIANGAVNADKIDLLAVSTAKIQDNAVDNSKMAQMAAETIKGNAGASAADAEDLTIYQVTSMLNTFDVSNKGVVPAPTTVEGRFLKDDGTWAVPAAGGGGGSVSSINDGPRFVRWTGTSEVCFYVNDSSPSRTTYTIADNSSVLFPFVLGRDMKISGLGCYITVPHINSDENLKLSVFESNPLNGAPALYMFSVKVDAGTVGQKRAHLPLTVTEMPILSAGTMYWMQVSSSLTCGISAIPKANCKAIGCMGNTLIQEEPITLINAGSGGFYFDQTGKTPSDSAGDGQGFSDNVPAIFLSSPYEA